MTNHRRAALAAAATLGATLVAAPLLGASAAHAERGRAVDTTRDVKLFQGGEEPQDRPRERSLDLVRIDARHERRRLALGAEVRELAADDYAVTWEVETPTDTWRVTFDDVFAESEVELVLVGQDTVPCAGLTGSASDRTDRVQVIVPRRCLERPDWVRFGAEAWRFVYDDGSVLVDDGRLDGEVPPEGAHVGGRRLHHG